MIDKIPFIGRQNELESIQHFVEQGADCQLVCIYGVGGIGKTRLLQEIQQQYSSGLQKIEKRRVKIALVEKFDESEWGQTFKIGVKSMADELDVELIEMNPLAEEDLCTIFKRALQQLPEVIILREGSDAALQTLVRHAIQQSIKVLTFGSRMQIDGLATRVTHDDYKGVVNLVEQVITDIDKHGTIGVIKGENDAIQKRRTDILYQVLHDYVDITPLQKELQIHGKDAEGIRQQAYKATSDLLRIKPRIKAIWTTLNEIAKGIVQALLDAKRTDVLVYSFDFYDSDIDLMCRQESPWKASISTEPREGGRLAVRLAVQAAYEHPLQPEYRMLPRLFTQKDMRQHGHERDYLWGATDIGWSSWLRSLHDGILQLQVATRILDFDNRDLHTPENMTRHIAETLNETAFTPFLQEQIEFFNKQQSGAATGILSALKGSLDRSFAQCFNQLSSSKRVLLLFDTSERVINEDAIRKEFVGKLPLLKNATILIAGRDAKEFGTFLAQKTGWQVANVELGAFSEQESLEYFQRKQQQMHISLEKALAQKLLFLSEGRPIMLDLAAEWRTRGIGQDWVINDDNWKDFRQLHGKEQEVRRKEFEKHLVSHIQKFQQPRDEVILLMAYIYPINQRMLSRLLKVENAGKLLEGVRDYAFVKTLPNGYLKLQDVMEEMVQDYVWPDFDPEGERRRWYSEQSLPYFQAEIDDLQREIDKYRQNLSGISNSSEASKKRMALALTIEELEQHMWQLKEQYLCHTLVTDAAKGLGLFVFFFDEATKTSRFLLRRRFFKEAQEYAKQLKAAEQGILEFHKARLLFDEGDYQQARELSDKLLMSKILSPEDSLESLWLLANSKVRLGEVDESIHDFIQARQLCQRKRLEPILHVRALNALGWVYRLIGDIDKARTYYIEARGLCLQEGGLSDKELSQQFGWISNNLSFALSYNMNTRQTAINIALENLEHWRAVDNDLGLGACYLVLGVAYYRSGHTGLSLKAFQHALEIFEPLKLQDWLGQIHSWRGALYLEMPNIEFARRDLAHALKIGASNIKAMTLYRFGRLHIQQGDLRSAERCMTKSLEYAKETPDYIYWLASVSRLILIAAESKETHKLKELQQQLDACPRKYEENNLGLAYIGLARLELNDYKPENRDTIITHLQEGISKVTEFGPYARSNVLSRLNPIEDDFKNVPPDAIRTIGRHLHEEFSRKEKMNIAYSAVTPIVYKWANWPEGEVRS